MATVLRSYQERAVYDDSKFKPVVVEENERVKVMVVSFRPGQFIPAHKPDVDLTFTVLQGKGRLITEGREEEIAPGAIAFVPAGEERGIMAETELVIMSAVTPPPTDGDHTAVKEKLQQNTWR